MFSWWKSAAPPPPSPEESIPKMKETLGYCYACFYISPRHRNLIMRHNLLTKKCDSELRNAHEYLKIGNQPAALQCLRRKKNNEEELISIMGAQTTLERQISMIESTDISFQTITAMKSGSETMKGLTGKMDFEKFEDTIGDIHEQLDIARELSEAIAQPLNSRFDDEDLLSELERIDTKRIETQLLNTRVSRNFPSVPLNPIPVKRQVIDLPRESTLSKEPSSVKQEIDEDELMLAEMI
jgi:charged multivesicular body protein 4